MPEPGGLQVGFDAFLSIVSGFGLYVMNGMRQDHRELSSRQDELAKSLPDTYARRDDVRAALQSLEAVQASLHRIEGRLGTQGDSR